MRGLTLWRPWPWAIFHAPRNAKRIENRPWRPWRSIIGQQIALHAGKTFDSDAADALCSMYGIHPDGDVPHGWEDEGIVGVATIAGFFTSEDEVRLWVPGQVEWWSGPVAWKLTAVRVLPAPIPCRGAQGLWPVPADVERRVLEVLA